MNHYIYSPIFIFLVGALSSLIVPFVGELSGAFFLILLSAPLWLSKIELRNDIIRSSLKIFIILLLTQIITDVFHDNLFVDKLRGVAIVINGMFFFFFFFVVYSQKLDLVKWYVFGSVISPFLFPSSFSESLEATYSEENVTYFKFVLVPFITNVITLLMLFTKSPRKHLWLALSMIVTGFIFIILGARSGGLILLSAGFLFYYIKRKKLSLRKLKRQLLLVTLTMYLFYVLLYVPLVVSGSLKSGNTKQLLKSANPYNPIEMLKIGRTDSLVPFYAFLDNPITGWGYLALDPGQKYAKLLFEMKEGDNFERVANHYFRIPGHSVIFYFACAYGFIALICVWLLYYRSVRLTFYSFLCSDRYLLYRMICLTTVTWHLFFSPSPHFKYLPSFFAYLMVSSMAAIKAERNKKN